MPRKTFINLTEEQKTKIIETALKEFAEHDYHSASLNNIISFLDVTKGSFYRYFESKNELYDFLVDHATDKKLKFISENLLVEREDFFEQFRRLMHAYIKFDLSFPVYGKFLFNVKYANNTVNSAVNIYKLEALLKETIRHGLKGGSINNIFDVDFIYHCIIKVAEGLEVYVGNTAADPTEDLTADKSLEEVFNKFIAFLKHGLSSRQEGER